MAELGLVAPRAVRNLQPLLDVLADDDDESVPPLPRAALAPLAMQLASLDAQIRDLDRKLLDWHRSSATSQRPQSRASDP